MLFKWREPGSLFIPNRHSPRLNEKLRRLEPLISLQQRTVGQAGKARGLAGPSLPRGATVHGPNGLGLRRRAAEFLPLESVPCFPPASRSALGAGEMPGWLQSGPKTCSPPLFLSPFSLSRSLHPSPSPPPPTRLAFGIFLSQIWLMPGKGSDNPNNAVKTQRPGLANQPGSFFFFHISFHALSRDLLGSAAHGAATAIFGPGGQRRVGGSDLGFLHRHPPKKTGKGHCFSKKPRGTHFWWAGRKREREKEAMGKP